jgi:hypothetical protein
MGLGRTKLLLGLLVMALAFGTMAPANAVTPGQVCVSTPSGIALSTTVQWTFNGNSSREIATDANGCASFPHLPQGQVEIGTDDLIIQDGSIQVVMYGGLDKSVTIYPSGYALLQSETNPPEVKHATISFRTTSGRVIENWDWPFGADAFVSNAHEGTEDEIESWYKQRLDSNNDEHEDWEIRRIFVSEDNEIQTMEPFWQDDQGVIHFYYFGDLARDTRDLTYYDPDTDQTVSLPPDPRSPLVRVFWHDSSLGLRRVTFALNENPQVIRLLNRPSLTKVPKKLVKFKSGKPVKVTVTLLDSYGKPWKNQWVLGDADTYTMKKSSKCKLKAKGKTKAKGEVTLIFCPKKSGVIYFGILSPYEGERSWARLNSSIQVKKS